MENRIIYNGECDNMLKNLNNIVTATAQDGEGDDFDRLLEAFVNESIVDNDFSFDDSASSDEVGQAPAGGNEEGVIGGDEDCCDPYFGRDDSIMCRVGQALFLLPCSRQQGYRAAELFLTEDKYETRRLCGEPLLVVSEACGPDIFTFTLRGLTETHLCDEPEIIIYSQDDIYPIERLKFKVERFECDAHCEATSCISRLAAGNYMLFIRGVGIEGLEGNCRSLEGGYCLPLIKVDKNAEGAIVQPSEFKASLKRSGNGLNVGLSFPRSVDKETGYSLFLYNADYNLVARGDAFVCDNLGKRLRRNLKISLRADYPLFGSYFAILAQNGTPCCRIELGIDSGRVVSFSSSPVAPYERDFLLFSELEKSPLWHNLRRMSVSQSIKEYTIGGYALKFFNTQRRSKGLNALTAVHHFIYDAREDKEAIEAVRKMCKLNYDCNSFEAADCIALCEAKSAIDPYCDATELLEQCANKGIALYNVSALVNCGAVVVKKIVQAMATYDTMVVCLLCSPSEAALLREAYPQLMRHFPAENFVERSALRADIFVSRVVEELHNSDLTLSGRALRLLTNAAKECWDGVRTPNIAADDIGNFVKSAIVENFIARTLKEIDARRIGDKKYLSTVEPEDINPEALLRSDKKEFEQSLEELDRMVGLDDVKNSIKTTFNRLRNSAERRRMGLKVREDECHHMIFTGNPGTGKTTVAKMVGRIYRALGLLTKGEVIYADRGKIVGRYIGDTEHNMQCLLAEAKGNVLFIDEAYTLCDTQHDRRDYGYRAIECLLTALTQKNSDMIVILAGYEKEMQMLLQSNQGLSGRFPHKFCFKDYTADELMLIAERKLADEDYELSDEARTLLRTTINDTVGAKGWDFSNARWVEQYVSNGIIPAQSDRLMRIARDKSRDEYRRILVEDIRTAFLEHKPKSEARGRYREIGFIA